MHTNDCEKLCTAAIAGDLEKIDLILDGDGSLVSCRGKVREDHRSFMSGQDAEGGWMPLHLATYYGQSEAARRLIERGADLNAVAQNAIGNTPLHTAVVGGQIKCVTVVLEHGPDLSVKDASGLSALDLARANGASGIVSLIEEALTSG